MHIRKFYIQKKQPPYSSVEMGTAKLTKIFKDHTKSMLLISRQNIIISIIYEFLTIILLQSQQELEL